MKRVTKKKKKKKEEKKRKKKYAKKKIENHGVEKEAGTFIRDDLDR